MHVRRAIYQCGPILFPSPVGRTRTGVCRGIRLCRSPPPPPTPPVERKVAISARERRPPALAAPHAADVLGPRIDVLDDSVMEEPQ